MAGWLSSKLKEAESFLQQIDQQAAESLGKPEKEKHGGISKNKRGLQGNSKPILDLSLAGRKDGPHETHTRLNLELGSETPSPALSKPLKKSDQGLNGNARSEIKGPSSYRKKQPNPILQAEANSEKKVGKDDWTELLASPNVDLAPFSALASSVGSSDSGRTGYSKRQPLKSTSNLNKSGGRHQKSDDILLGRGSTISPSTSSSVIGLLDTPRLGDETLKRRLENDLAGLVGAQVGEESIKNSTFKNTDMNGDVLNTGRRLSGSGNLVDATEGHDEVAEDHSDNVMRVRQQQKQVNRPPSPASEVLDHSFDNRGDKYERMTEATHLATPEGAFEDVYKGVHGLEKNKIPMQNVFVENDGGMVSDSPLAVESNELATAYEVSESEELPETRALPSSLQAEEDSYESSSMSDEDSDGGTESEDDEEMERQKSAHKKRIARRNELTTARAAEAQAAITERKCLVEKLENEFTSLQLVLAEREEQQGREAAELRTSIAEVMQAIEAEKKLHSSTRMQALSVESQLENQNADLAKSLGALQWELEEEMSQVLKARRMIDAKEAVKADLERRLAKIRGDICSSQQNGEMKVVDKAKGEDWSFEEEQSDLWKKIQQCQIQVKDLEVKISGLKDNWHVPSETEKELEIRLAQMTDYLIQKQAQVEALSSEKATLLIRLETLTKTIEEEKALVFAQASRNKHGRRTLDWESNYYDMEYGSGKPYDSKVKPFAYENGESSAVMATGMIGIPFSPVLRQLNGFVSAGIFFLRKHRWAQAFTVMYIIILHLWVWFVLFMNSKPARTLASQELGLPKNVSELKNGSNVINII